MCSMQHMHDNWPTFGLLVYILHWINEYANLEIFHFRSGRTNNKQCTFFKSTPFRFCSTNHISGIKKSPHILIVQKWRCVLVTNLKKNRRRTLLILLCTFALCFNIAILHVSVWHFPLPSRPCCNHVKQLTSDGSKKKKTQNSLRSNWKRRRLRCRGCTFLLHLLSRMNASFLLPTPSSGIIGMLGVSSIRLTERCFKSTPSLLHAEKYE